MEGLQHEAKALVAIAIKQSIENGLDIIFQTSIHHDTLFNKYFLKNEDKWNNKKKY